MGYIKLAGTSNPHVNWTTEVILERDEDGNVTKSLKQGEPVDLSKEQQSKLEAQGFVFEKSSKDEAETFANRQEEAQTVGADIAGSGPLLSAPAPTTAAAESSDANDNK